MADHVESAVLIGYAGVAASLTLSIVGAGVGTAKSAKGLAALASMKADQMYKCMLPVVMAGICAIYGMVMAIVLVGKIHTEGYTMHMGYSHLAAGVLVGLSTLVSGIAIGVVGEAAIPAIGHQPKFFFVMVLVLIFTEALGLYGLIVGLVVANK